MIRFVLCCIFREHPVKFLKTAGAYLPKIPQEKRKIIQVTMTPPSVPTEDSYSVYSISARTMNRRHWVRYLNSCGDVTSSRPLLDTGARGWMKNG